MTEFLQSYDKNRKRIGVLVDAYDITRTRRINADYTLTFSVPMASDDYQEKLPLKGHVMDERGQYYVINSRRRSRDGRKRIAQISCTHVMFKLADYKLPNASYIDEAYGVGISELTALLSTATGGRFRFAVDDSFDLVDVKNFGGGNCLQALNDIVNLYGAEIEPDNLTVHLCKRIGNSTQSLQYRIGKNIVSATYTDDGNSLCTRLFAEMKDSRTWIGQPASILTEEERALLSAVPGAIVDGKLAVNYLISPYAGIWASDSVPFYDDTLQEQDVTDPLKLLEVARKRLREREVPALEISVSAADLFKLDKSEPVPGLGDTVMLVDPEMELTSITARITELTEYPYALDQHSQVTVSNVARRDFGQILADLESSRREIEQAFSGGRIRTEAFEAAAKQAIVDISNSRTELIYPAEGGILAQDKANALRQVRLTSAGLGISTDGWKTVRSAITADGIVAERIVGQAINGVSLVIGSGNAVTKINPTGISAGHEDFSSAPFRVDMAGNVVANKLTANAASIANSTFNSGQIVGSSINVGNGMFTVSSAGVMSAVNGFFSGSISASTISGGMITGTTIQTQANGRRIQIDTTGLFLYGADNVRRLSFLTAEGQSSGGIIFAGPSGAGAGIIIGTEGVMAISSNSALLLAAPNGTVYFQGSVDFGNAIVQNIPISAIATLSQQLSSKADVSALASKATQGDQTELAGGHNHGIKNGTVLLTQGGGTVVWSAYEGHTHKQT
ncbi:phage tail protein [Gorillibacterium sp. sgz500922]|uniref:phage tail protein n=1 Tax=Gorillibacterium sp. sgz500922 TaxID=3446694 RepID=UPI003F67773A